MLQPFAFLCCSCLAGCLARPSSAPLPRQGDYDAARAQLASFVQLQMRQHGVVGLSLAVLDDRHVSYAAGFGFADKEAGIPATAHTQYRAGSTFVTTGGTA
ncbi:MAG: hypothetical protein BWK76_16105 [Desulfobulbaceae bacterium A2]|nr:MAG: hypothetical protein BWK76_16105 [Desulfobulbaceae bacterium A2]